MRVGGLALLSFTNAAIREFKTATINVGRRDLLSDPNYVGTFDSFVERYILAPFGHLLTGANKRPKLFPGPRPGDWNNTRLKVWNDGKGGGKIPVPAWEVIPYPEDMKIRFKSSIAFGNQPVSRLPIGAVPQNCCHWVTTPMPNAVYLGMQTPSRAAAHRGPVLARRFREIIVDEAQDYECLAC